MKDRNPLDDLFYKLSAVAERGDRATSDDDYDLADDLLRAYRAGELSEADQERVERALIENPRLRARLVVLAGVAEPEARAEIRQRVLVGGSEQSLESFAEHTSRRRKAAWLVPLAVAASVLLAVLLLPRPAPLPDDLQYEVTATGLAEVRGDVDASDRVEAEPTTLLRIHAEPTDMPNKDIEFALYAPSADGRIVLRADIEPEVERGNANFRIVASDLVGDVPGTYTVFVVAGRAGELPERVQLEGTTDVAGQLRADGLRRVYPLEISLLAAVVREEAQAAAEE